MGGAPPPSSARGGGDRRGRRRRNGGAARSKSEGAGTRAREGGEMGGGGGERENERGSEGARGGERERGEAGERGDREWGGKGHLVGRVNRGAGPPVRDPPGQPRVPAPRTRLPAARARGVGGGGGARVGACARTTTIYIYIYICIYTARPRTARPHSAPVPASRCQVQPPGQVRGDALVESLHAFSIAAQRVPCMKQKNKMLQNCCRILPTGVK